MEENEVTTTRKFIFDDSFYNNLENSKSALPPQRDMLAPINEQIPTINMQSVPPVETPTVEPISETRAETVQNNIEIPTMINIPNEVETNGNIDIKENVNENIVVPEINSIEEKQEPVEIAEPGLIINGVSVDVQDINNNNQNEINTENLEETKIEEPLPINVNEEQVIENQPQEQPIETKEEATNLYNVGSGVDTSLEQELFNNKEEVDIYTPVMPTIKEVKEKNVYRAARKPRTEQPIENFESNNSDTSDVQVIDNIEKPSEPIEPLTEEVEEWHPPLPPEPIIITEEINYYEEDANLKVEKSNLLEELAEKEKQTGKISILARYGDDFCSHDYVTNPAIGRDEEIKQMGLILLTPEKSAILVGKPGIGKTSIVEGFAYRLQRGLVPDALKGYRVVSIKTASLLGTLPTGETRLQTLVDEIKDLDKIILFIDEIHMLMGATNESSLDFANMFKEALGRGGIKMIGATTSDEYERYVLRDKAFVRRFQRVDVNEPTKEQTIEIVMGSLPKIEKNTGAKFKYTHYIQVEIVTFIVDITAEYKRVYGIGSRYPDICLTLVTQAFSQAIFDNRKEVNILDIRNAISNSKNIYPDVIKKELINFDQKFSKLIEEEK